MKWLRWLHEDEGGFSFLPFILPILGSLILGGIQQRRQGEAQRQLEEAEESEIPGEEAAIREGQALRGISQTSAAASQIGQPRKQLEVSRKIARAKNVLSQPAVDPMMIAMQYLAGKLGQPDVPQPPQPRRSPGGFGSFF